MSISNISVDKDEQSFETPRKNSSVTAPGDHILLSFYDAWSLENPRINNHSFTELTSIIILGNDSAQFF